MKKILCFFSLVVMVWVLGCATEQKVVQQPVVTGEKCDAPVWVVGDSWKWRTSDKKVREYKVVRVSEIEYIVESPYDVSMNCLDKKNLQNVAHINPEGSKVQESYKGWRYYEFPLYVGKKWGRRSSVPSE